VQKGTGFAALGLVESFKSRISLVKENEILGDGNMMDLLQSLGDGVLIGLIYALLGLCVVIIFKASEAFNFAVGEFLVIGSFLFYVLFFDLNIPLLIALPVGLLAAAITGAIIERLTIKPWDDLLSQ